MKVMSGVYGRSTPAKRQDRPVCSLAIRRKLYQIKKCRTKVKKGLIPYLDQSFYFLFQFPFDTEPLTPQTPQRCPTGQKTPLWAHFVECA